MLTSGFLSGCKGRLFLSVQPSSAGHMATSSSGATVILPPFADEMNKTRHLLTSLMCQLATQGYDSFLLDNYGTGDSEGDLDLASIDIWRTDLQQLLQLIGQSSYQHVSFVAVRFGSLQLFDLLNQYPLPIALKHVVLWQPLFETTKFWQQFARIKLAETLGSDDKLTLTDLTKQLNAGNDIEIAGYPFNAVFYNSLMQLQSQFPKILNHQPVHWFNSTTTSSLAPALQQSVAVLSKKCQLNVVHLPCQPYWQAAELVQAPGLISQTVALFTGLHQHD